jgi:hypothetical protein
MYHAQRSNALVSRLHIAKITQLMLAVYTLDMSCVREVRAIVTLALFSVSQTLLEPIEERLTQYIKESFLPEESLSLSTALGCSCPSAAWHAVLDASGTVLEHRVENLALGCFFLRDGLVV